jgi:hypothetical protein
MTEADWLNDWGRADWMLTHLSDRRVPRTKAGRRKLRLFAVGCCRAVRRRLPDRRLWDAVLTAERFADAAASRAELDAARTRVAELAYDSGLFGRSEDEVRVAIDMAIASCLPQAHAAAGAMAAAMLPLAGEPGGETLLCRFLRCVFGNPFRPVPDARRWRTTAAVGVARGIYDDGAFDRLPILADALEDAGCADADVIAHCRNPRLAHVRGCWVVDLVLGNG